MHICRQGVRMTLAGLERQTEHSSTLSIRNYVSAPYMSSKLKDKLFHYLK
jgi:hypothetical protein